MSRTKHFLGKLKKGHNQLCMQNYNISKILWTDNHEFQLIVTYMDISL